MTTTTFGLELKSDIKDELTEEFTNGWKDELVQDLSNDLLAKEVISNVNVQANEDVRKDVNYLKQISKIKLARTCEELAKAGITESGDYELDPDGPMTGELPIWVACDFTTNSTTIKQDLKNAIEIEICETGPGCSSVKVEYESSMKQIETLKSLSLFCWQEIEFLCSFAPLNFNGVSLAWWADKNSNNYTIGEPYNCQCDKIDECVDQISKCNCDAKLPEILTDHIRIKDKRKLPITGFHYGPITYENAKASVLIKNFHCSSNYLTNDLHPLRILRDDCNYFRFNYGYNDGYEFSMRYINSRDCYITFDLTEQTTIKFAVSDFLVCTFTYQNLVRIF